MHSVRQMLMALWLCALLAFAAGTAAGETPTVPSADSSAPKFKYIILMISDGFGPAGVTLAREYQRTVAESPELLNETLDSMLVGSSITYSKNALVTDSAAAATAFACGISVPNGYIAMTEDSTPHETLMELAKKEGYLTGVATTCAIVDATPAAFTSHSVDRNLTDIISLQQIRGLGEDGYNAADLMIGGGGCIFKNNCRGEDKSFRSDGVDIEEVIKNKGWSVELGRSFVDKMLSDESGYTSQRLPPPPLLNLIVDDYYMSYEIDRDASKEPSIEEITSSSIKYLSDNLVKGKNKGFFLVVEGGRIDIAGHANDAAAYVHDTLAYLKALKVAKDFVDSHEDAILISLSDHETGGLTLSAKYKLELKGEADDWNFNPIKDIKISTEKIYLKISDALKTGLYNKKYMRDTILKDYLAIRSPTHDEVEVLSKIDNSYSKYKVMEVLSSIVSKRTQVQWSTTAHTSVDTFVYAHGKYKQRFVGSHRSVKIYNILRSIISPEKKKHHSMVNAGKIKLNSDYTPRRVLDKRRLE